MRRHTARVHSFLAQFSALLNRNKPERARVIGSLHTDNAGDFLSREFTSLLESNGIDATTCPPHVHSLNGIVKRAIRSVISSARSALVSSSAPTSFWNHAIDDAVDILNRTTGPPGSPASSYELLTGQQPKVMHIMPLGCAAARSRLDPALPSPRRK
eukprot:5489172-Pleurochrysis_carterae.AAC.5